MRETSNCPMPMVRMLPLLSSRTVVPSIAATSHPCPSNQTRLPTWTSTSTAPVMPPSPQ